MIKPRWMFVSACIVAALTASAVSFAAQADDTPWMERRVTQRVVARVEHKLNLTDDQRVQIRAILKTEEPTILALATRAREERKAMSQLTSFDEARVSAVAQTYGVTNTEIIIERAKVVLQVRAVLNDAQRKQLETLKGKLRGHMAERMDGFIDAL